MTSMPKAAPEISTEWLAFAQLSAPLLYEVLRFRQQIFVVEQRSPYPDLDGRDLEAAHLLLRADGVLAGCLRLVPPPRLRLGRVAVSAALRGHGHGRRLVEQALACCRERYPAEPIVLSAQAHLVRFYRSFGFATTGGPYDEHGLMHVDMARGPS